MEGEGSPASDQSRFHTGADEDELSEGWKEFWNSNDEERSERTAHEKENVSTAIVTERPSSSTCKALSDEEDFLALPLESPRTTTEAASRMRTRARAAAAESRD